MKVMQTVRARLSGFGENVSEPVFYNACLPENADCCTSELNSGLPAYFECSKGFWLTFVHKF